jgi:hypothetical protein
MLYWRVVVKMVMRAYELAMVGVMKAELDHNQRLDFTATYCAWCDRITSNLERGAVA